MGRSDIPIDAGEAKLEPVESEAICALGYDAASATLFVRFHTGGLYAYLDVSPDLAARFRRSNSKGRFFQDEVDPVFRYIRLA